MYEIQWWLFGCCRILIMLQAEIIKALDEVCNVLPDTISQQCKQFIDTYGKAILIILKETMDPQTVCTTLGLCQGTKLPERAPVGKEMKNKHKIITPLVQNRNPTL